VVLNRNELYRFPWSKSDNPGGWVEVTDECDLVCPGCYRHRLEGHRPLDEVKEDILACRRLTNCDRIGIAGGEPLIYPHLLEVVEFIARNGMKSLLLTNGEKLTREFVKDLKKAGLVKFHFHVDSGMQRPGWMGKTETEMNELRQKYADLIWEVGGMQCGYNITIFPSTVQFLPDIVSWARRNMDRVHHVSLIAFRAIPLSPEWEFRVFDKPVDPRLFQHATDEPELLSLTAEIMYGVLADRFSEFRPCTYLPGTAAPDSYKFLVTVQVGSQDPPYGVLGSKTVEIVQVFHHFFKGRYFDFLKSPVAGRKLFLLSLFDRSLRRAFKKFLLEALKRPSKLFRKVYAQSISLQQPNEFFNGQVNLCDGCMNMMMFKGELIPSCRLDEYRLLGGPLTPVRRKPEEVH
jgi:organic radical activating enzyme